MIVSVSRLLILFHWSTSSLTCSSWTFHKRGDPCYLTQPMYTLTCLQIHIGTHRRKKSEPSQRCKGTNLEARERMWTSRAVSHLWGSLGRWLPSYLCWMSPICPAAPSPTFSTMPCAPRKLTFMDPVNGLLCLLASAWVWPMGSTSRSLEDGKRMLFPQLSPFGT